MVSMSSILGHLIMKNQIILLQKKGRPIDMAKWFGRPRGNKLETTYSIEKIFQKIWTCFKFICKLSIYYGICLALVSGKYLKTGKFHKITHGIMHGNTKIYMQQFLENVKGHLKYLFSFKSMQKMPTSRKDLLDVRFKFDNTVK